MLTLFVTRWFINGSRRMTMTDFITHDTVKTHYWHKLEDGRIQCDLCPRFCKLHKDQRGLCFVRQNLDDQIVMTSYGRSSGFAIDPSKRNLWTIFLPGTPVFSFGTAGCNLACNFCQNWISANRGKWIPWWVRHRRWDCTGGAGLWLRQCCYTYNDPVVFHEYAIDTAQACRSLGIKSVAVSAGYVCAEPRAEFYQWMDAANIDLKALPNNFIIKLSVASEPVLETLKYIKHETSVWLELTTLIIPVRMIRKRKLKPWPNGWLKSGDGCTDALYGISPWLEDAR